MLKSRKQRSIAQARRTRRMSKTNQAPKEMIRLRTAQSQHQQQKLQIRPAIEVFEELFDSKI